MVTSLNTCYLTTLKVKPKTTKKNQWFINILCTIEQRMKAFALISMLEPQITQQSYGDFLEEIAVQGNFYMLAINLDSQIVGVVSYSIITRFYGGRLIHMANLIVDQKYRGSGYGKILMNEVEKIGKEQKCTKCVLDSYVDNYSAHKVFFQAGFSIKGFHFIKNL